MSRLLFWVKNCLIENNRECRHYCGVCNYYHMCSDDGLDLDRSDSFGIRIMELRGCVCRKETI